MATEDQASAISTQVGGIDDYARPKTLKGNPRNRYPFNVKKWVPKPPPPTLFQPAPSGETPND